MAMIVVLMYVHLYRFIDGNDSLALWTDVSVVMNVVSTQRSTTKTHNRNAASDPVDTCGSLEITVRTHKVTRGG